MSPSAVLSCVHNIVRVLPPDYIIRGCSLKNDAADDVHRRGPSNPATITATKYTVITAITTIRHNAVIVVYHV